MVAKTVTRARLQKAIDIRLRQRCLEHLNGLPHIQVKASSALQDNDLAIDGKLILHTPYQSVDYAYQMKLRTTSKTVGVIINQIKASKVPPEQHLVLLTQYLPEAAIEQMLEHQIEFIDSVGNMYLNSPAAYVLIRGKRPPKEDKHNLAAFSVTGLKLVFCILQSPKVLKTTVREMAAAAGISIGSVSRIIQSLDQNVYLQWQRDGSFRIKDYDRLLQRWQIGYAEKLRPKLLLGTYAPTGDRRFSDVAEAILAQAKQERYLIGGELGGEIATDYLRPTTAALYVPENHRKIATQLRLKPSSNGDITFFKTFGTQMEWKADQDTPLVDPLLIQAELLLDQSDRLCETAERLYLNTIKDRADA